MYGFSADGLSIQWCQTHFVSSNEYKPFKEPSDTAIVIMALSRCKDTIFSCNYQVFNELSEYLRRRFMRISQVIWLFADRHITRKSLVFSHLYTFYSFILRFFIKKYIEKIIWNNVLYIYKLLIINHLFLFVFIFIFNVGIREFRVGRDEEWLEIRLCVFCFFK